MNFLIKSATVLLIFLHSSQSLCFADPSFSLFSQITSNPYLTRTDIVKDVVRKGKLAVVLSTELLATDEYGERTAFVAEVKRGVVADLNKPNKPDAVPIAPKGRR